MEYWLPLGSCPFWGTGLSLISDVLFVALYIGDWFHMDAEIFSLRFTNYCFCHTDVPAAFKDIPTFAEMLRRAL